MSEMSSSYKLYNRTLNSDSCRFKHERDKLRVSFLSARNNVKHLIASIHTQLHGLTVHDISHVDSLWRLADVIIGSDYPLNEAEAYVLGSAFLLHDSAHTKEAFTGGLKEIKATIEWRDLIAQDFEGVEPESNSQEEKKALFFTLRHLHAEQAVKLPSLKWDIPNGDQGVYLFEDFELREYYGELIGEIAASHHWSSAKVLHTFENRILTPPSCLEHTDWDVDALKVALILRTADAAHLDAKRAPWFLFALQQPEGVSQEHWRFQAKLGAPQLTNGNELKFSAGSKFSVLDKKSWWLAYDTINMVDSELRQANSILGEFNRKQFAAERVAGAGSVDIFSKHVRVTGWVPIDTSPKITNIPFVVANLGGEALYGGHPYVAIRELMQNSADAIRALRDLGYLEKEDGKITIAIKSDSNGSSISVRDNGIGMSKFVLTHILTDFGTSLWSSAYLRSELPGLASAKFKSVGKFGIGFFSVFMLGQEVSVITRRFETKEGEETQWKLHFESGLSGRPTVSQPTLSERLKNHGTEIKVYFENSVLKRLFRNPKEPNSMDYLSHVTDMKEDERLEERLEQLVKIIFPMSDIDVYCQCNDGKLRRVIGANDWKDIGDNMISSRASSENLNLTPVVDMDGKIIGKLAVGSQYTNTMASVTFKGLWCGNLSGMSGFIATDSNNTEARRNDGIVTLDMSIWAEWAGSVLSKNSKLSRRELLALHPLVPNVDLRVWRVGNGFFNVAELKEYLCSADEVFVHYGDVGHETYDDISSDSFSSDLSLNDGVVTVPHFSNLRYPFSRMYMRSWITSSSESFPWNIGVSSIDYSKIFISLLEEIWGECDESEITHEVGSVANQEVLREVTRYSRS